MYRTLRKGEGTASPYNDCVVTLKIRIETSDKILFTHENPLETKVADLEDAK
jgi:hypothetical protein